jgi:protein-S-isoprenylcysteine O-methyltransferase Ste14
MPTDEISEGRDHAGVIAPPPLIFGGALVLTLILDWIVGDPSFGLSYDWRMLLTLIFVIAGFGFIGTAAVGLRNAKTHVEPWKPTTALVTKGIYSYTRNPIYLGMALGYIGLSFLGDGVLSLVALPIVVAVIHYGVILREERYLEAKFGEVYRDYLVRVRRWL